MNTDSAYPSLPGLPESTEVFAFAAGPFNTNCYVLVDRVGGDATSVSPGSARQGRAVVIDPGLGAWQVVSAQAKERNFAVEKVVLTHGHIDHIRDAAAFGVPVCIHPLDRFFLEESLEGSPFADLFDVDNMNVPETIVDLGDSVEMGGVSFEIFHMPGHSPGHVMFRIPGLVIGGDVLFRGGVGRTDLAGCSPEDMLLSLKKLVVEFADEDLVLPGHGPVTTVGEEKRTNSFLQSVQ